MSFKRFTLGNLPLAKASEKGALFVDKTEYIARLEDSDLPAMLFLRPRRFGKTFFTRVLYAYYDVAFKDAFERTFEGSRIQNHCFPSSSISSTTSSTGQKRTNGFT